MNHFEHPPNIFGCGLQEDFFTHSILPDLAQEEKVMAEPLNKSDGVSSEVELLVIKKEASTDRTVEQGPTVSFENNFVETQKESMIEVIAEHATKPHFTVLGNIILSQLTSNVLSTLFRFPVDPYEDGVFDYHEIVKNPIDLQTMRLRLERGKYKTKDEFYQDLELIITNSRLYHRNNPDLLMITKRFENLCIKVRRNADPQRKKSARQISHGQIKQAKGKKSKNAKGKIYDSSSNHGDSLYQGNQ